MFFKVFYDRMRLAQQEIRATVTVNMFESKSVKRDDDMDLCIVRSQKGTVQFFTLFTWICSKNNTLCPHSIFFNFFFLAQLSEKCS